VGGNAHYTILFREVILTSFFLKYCDVFIFLIIETVDLSGPTRNPEPTRARPAKNPEWVGYLPEVGLPDRVGPKMPDPDEHGQPAKNPPRSLIFTNSTYN